MKATIQDNKLIIELELETPTPSASGKNLVVASTHGIVTTTAQVNGKHVKLGVNAFIAAKITALRNQKNQPNRSN